MVHGRVMPVTSASWKASLPIALVATCPLKTRIGTLSIWAVASGVTVLVAPGPEVTMQTPGLPVARAYPSAQWPLACSWRFRMNLAGVL